MLNLWVALKVFLLVLIVLFAFNIENKSFGENNNISTLIRILNNCLHFILIVVAACFLIKLH